MKIAIDASQIIYQTGVSFYTSNLLRALSEVDRRDGVVVFGSSLRARTKLENDISKLNLGQNFKTKILSLPPSFFEFFWNQFHLIDAENFVGQIDVFHASDWTQPPAKKAKLVTTIHDLAVLKYPRYFPPRILRNHHLRLKWIKKEADGIIAVSRSTKKDIVRLLEINPEKIYVVYEAVPKEHQIKVDKGEIEKIKKKHNLKDYILSVGTREPRKNLKRVIEAFSKIHQFTPASPRQSRGRASSPIHQLVIVGKKGWGTKNVKCQMPNVKYIDQVSDGELAALYAGAKCFVYPSLYEGFGLPVLEAMYHGCPVITADVSSLPEVAGKAAILVDPKDVGEISQAIKKIISDKSTYNKLKEKGLIQVKKFSWKKTAEKTLAVYRKVLRC